MKIVSDALLLRRTDRGEADLILSFFTEGHGVLTTIAYSARRSKRRFAVLEPFHTMRIEADNGARDMAVLHHATVTDPRLGFLSSLDRMAAASKVLGWVRSGCTEKVAEPEVWAHLLSFLDTAQRCGVEELTAETAAFGLVLLRALGWAPPSTSVRKGMPAEEALRVVEDAFREHVAA